MISRRDLQSALACLLALSLASTPAHALISLDDGHDHIYVTGNVGWAWDSNLFANSDAKSDASQTASIAAEYQRRAGWIGVNVNAQVDSAVYNHYRAENFSNPKVGLELTKETGRTTGSFTLNVARESRADAAINIRTTSWNYSTGLSFRYPIVTIYTLSGQLGYSLVTYGQNAFPDLSTYTASFDLIRLYSTERDVMLGYRFRRGNTADTTYDDHAFTAGLTGKLIRGLNGSLRAGYQVRVPHGTVAGSTENSKFGSWTASASATYPFNKRLNFTGTLAKDFSTTANDLSVDTTTAAVDAQYAFSSHWTFAANLSAGDSQFLGLGGLREVSKGPPPIYVGPRRRDHYLTGSLSANYSLNEHLKASASYSWFKNWSTLEFADFVRSAYNLSLSSRW